MDYTSSPIKSIRNSGYNYHSQRSQQFEEDFWKLKLQKAEGTIDELRKENQMMNRRLIDMGRIEQELREKIAKYEDDWKERSRKLSTERISQRVAETQERGGSMGEIERLYKEVRILKNIHEVELSKLKEENRKLKKQIGEVNSLSNSAKEKQQSGKIISKLNEEIMQLKKKIESGEAAVNRGREQKGKIVADNEKLRKEVQQIKLKEKLAQKEEEEKLLDYKKRFEELSEIQMSRKMNKVSHISEGQESQQLCIPLISQRSKQSQLNFNFDNKNQFILIELKEQIEKLNSKILEFEKRQGQQEKKTKFEKSSLQNQKLNCEIKMKKIEEELIEGKKELQDVLKKLAPLLHKKKESVYSKESVEEKASLSILQIFLKKYKIQAF